MDLARSDRIAYRVASLCELADRGIARRLVVFREMLRCAITELFADLALSLSAAAAFVQAPRLTPAS